MANMCPLASTHTCKHVCASPHMCARPCTCTYKHTHTHSILTPVYHLCSAFFSFVFTTRAKLYYVHVPKHALDSTLKSLLHWWAGVDWYILWHTRGGQRTACRIKFSPSTMWVLGLTSGSQTWQQEFLPTEPSRSPQCRMLTVSSLFNIFIFFHKQIFFIPKVPSDICG